MPTATSTKPAMAGLKRKSDAQTGAVKKPRKAFKDGPHGSLNNKKLVAGLKKRAAPVTAQSDDSNDSEDSAAASDRNLESGGVSLDDFNASEEDGDSEELKHEKISTFEGVHPERVKANVNGTNQNGSSSKEAHAKQKQLVQERKAAKPLADQLARTKKLWERLRRKSHIPVDERKKLVAELFEIITGRVKDFVLKHDSVRVVQTAIKYANPEQKRMIAKELQGTYRQLAESRYAKFLIGKLLVQGDDQIRDLIVPEFYGHVRRLIRHPEASWILDDVYRGVATRQQKAVILREWYGAEYALFQQDATVSGDLRDILAKDSGKRGPIMKSLQELINGLIQKKSTGFTLLHDAMLQYFLNVKPGTEEVTDFIELLKGDEEGDLLKNLAFTKSGARVVSLALAYGAAKDRKQILKTYKDTLQLMSADPYGHIIILTAYEVIDDTVLTAKSIFPEILSKDSDKQVENVVFAANDLNARTVLLYLFKGRSKLLFPSSHAADLEILKEVDEIRPATSKKDPEARRQELAKALSPLLLKAIESAPKELAATSFGCQLITDVLLHSDGDRSGALAGIASLAAGDPEATSTETIGQEEEAMNTHSAITEPPHISQTPSGGKMLRSLIAGGRYDEKLKKVVPTQPLLKFGDILYPIIKDHLISWATGSSSFVILALLESEQFESKVEVQKALRQNRKELERAATEETAEQKAKTAAALSVTEVPEGDGKKQKKKAKKPVREREVGNKGSKMLLELI